MQLRPMLPRRRVKGNGKGCEFRLPERCRHIETSMMDGTRLPTTAPNSSAAEGRGSEGLSGGSKLIGRHQAFEFGEPVEDDVDGGFSLSAHLT